MKGYQNWTEKGENALAVNVIHCNKSFRKNGGGQRKFGGVCIKQLTVKIFKRGRAHLCPLHNNCTSIDGFEKFNEVL